MAVSYPPSTSQHTQTAHHRCLSDEICAEHGELAREIGMFDLVADEVGKVPLEKLRTDVDRVYGLLTQRVIPHMRAEHELRTRLAVRDHVRIGPEEDHGEIGNLARQLSRLRSHIAKGDAGDAPAGARHILYELHALTRLHFADELLDRPAAQRR